MSQQLLALKYPDRAESLPDYERYRVFLDHWQPLIDELSSMRRALYARRESRTLGIYAPQGSGKTLFARQLFSDITKGGTAMGRDRENLWHRIAEERLADGNTQIAQVRNLKVLLRDAGNDDPWADDLRAYLEQSQNRAIVLLDEADQAYLQLRLLGMEMQEFLKSSDQARLLTASADKFVKQCRTTLRGALFVLLSNKRDFLDQFALAVNEQHQGMMVVTELPAADGPTKEKVVRINTNRLNAFSYWYCINNARPQRKSAIYDALAGAGTFPAAFEAVDAAVSDADQTRIGRPAIKNNLTLCVLYEDPDTSELTRALGQPTSYEFTGAHCSIQSWTDRWASAAMRDGTRQSADMLESEWNLRVILLGSPLVASLLDPRTDATALKATLDSLFAAQSPYVSSTTLADVERRRTSAISAVCGGTATVPSSFWNSGQGRSGEYEEALRRLYPTYDTGSTPVTGFRPDLLVRPYRECSVLAAGANDASQITTGIRRDANFVEVTATRKVTRASVVDYLGGKLRNYIKLMEAM